MIIITKHQSKLDKYFTVCNENMNYLHNVLLYKIVGKSMGAQVTNASLNLFLKVEIYIHSYISERALTLNKDLAMGNLHYSAKNSHIKSTQDEIEIKSFPPKFNPDT